MNGGGWEGLDMSTICLDMFLGLPPLKWPVGVVFFGSNPPPPPRIVVGQKAAAFLSMGPLDSPVRIGHKIVQCPVPTTSVAHWSQPLDLSVLVMHRIVWCD
jgi:hypothetical protein